MGRKFFSISVDHFSEERQNDFDQVTSLENVSIPLNPYPAEYIKMSRPFQIFRQSDYLIQIIDINSHTELQTMQIQISWLLRSLIWIYTVCKGRVYPGSAGQGLSYFGLQYHVE